MDAQTLKSELQSELFRILDYWMEHTIDHRNGGFVGELDHQNQAREGAPKGAVLNARILWTFSAAYRRFPEKEYLRTAKRAYEYMTARFVDREHGGVFWTLDENGDVLSDRKQIYALAFTIYGCVEYYRACGYEKALELAIELFRVIETYSFDSVNNGYLEALRRDWSPLEDVRLSEKDENALKTMNTHLHILEAYTNLYRVWKGDLLKQALKNLIEVFLHRILRKNRSFGLFFDEQWKLSSGNISFGHDIEGSWLLHEAAVVLGETDLLSEVERTAIQMAEKVAIGGVSRDFAVLEELHVATGEQDHYRHWWPQAEGIVGFYNTFELSGEERYLELACRIWGYTKANIIDHENGEWFWKADSEGNPSQDEYKVGLWKCPYHNGRACLEIIERVAS